MILEMEKKTLFVVRLFCFPYNEEQWGENKGNAIPIACVFEIDMATIYWKIKKVELPDVYVYYSFNQSNNLSKIQIIIVNW